MIINECKEKLNTILNVYCDQALYEEAKTKLLELKPVQLSNAICSTYRNLSEDEKDVLTLLIKIIQALYNNSSSEELLSDELYDKLYQVYVDQIGDEEVGAPIYALDTKEKVTHRFDKMRGTIQKVHFVSEKDKPEKENRKSLEYYENSWKRQLGESLFEEAIYLFTTKWDGLSACLEFNKEGELLRVLPRGDVKNNETEDKYYKFKDLKIDGYNLILYGNSTDTKFNDDFCVKCELVCSESNLKILNEKYGMEFKNRRSAVAGLLNSDDTPIALMKYVTIIPLRYQVGSTGNEEYVLPYESEYSMHKLSEFRNKEDRIASFKNIITTLQCNAEESGFPADGVVITILNKDIQNRLGRDTDRGINKYEVAYKFPPEVGSSYVIDVEFTTGTMGIITPVAKIKPIKLKGNTIKSINLGSMDRFEELDIRYGDEVKIKYDVIPYLYKDENCIVGDESVPYPTTCQYCGYLLQKNPTLMCVNEHCSCREIGKIVNYINKMNILDISTESVTALYNSGIIKSIIDLYSLKYKVGMITQLDGWGDKKINNIIDRINERKDIYDYQLLGSLGIQSIGRQMFKKVIEKYSMKELLDMCENENCAIYTLINNVPGIKEKTATKIVQGINKNFDLIHLLNDVLNIKISGGEKKGKICFTNVRNKEVEEKLELAGYEIVNSVTKDTTILVIPNGFTGSSSKIDKAKKYGTKILQIGDHELFKLYGGK